MPEEKNSTRATALGLYDTWVRAGQLRPALRCSETEKGMDRLGSSNFRAQLVEPRKKHIDQLKKARDLSAADKVVLMMMQDLPALEISSLVQRLSQQLVKDPNVKIFGPENRAFDCG